MFGNWIQGKIFCFKSKAIKYGIYVKNKIQL